MELAQCKFLFLVQLYQILYTSTAQCIFCSANVVFNANCFISKTSNVLNLVQDSHYNIPFFPTCQIFVSSPNFTKFCT